MTIIALEDIPTIDLEIMNETHREEIELINHIGELVKRIQRISIDHFTIDQASQQAVGKKLNEWLEHTRMHFSREEQMMEHYGFHAYPIHARAHREAFSQLEQVVYDWQHRGNLEALSDYLFDQWPNWFQQHVMTMDFMTAQYLNMRM